MAPARPLAGFSLASVLYLLGLAATAGATLSELRHVQSSLARIEAFNAVVLTRVEAIEVWRAAHTVAAEYGR